MTFRDLAGSAFTALLQRKIRSVLTIGGIALGSMLLFSSLSGGLGVLDVLQNRLEVGDRLLRIDVRSGVKSPRQSELRSIESSIPDTVTGDRRKRMAAVLARRSSRKETIALTIDRLRSFSKMDGVAEAYTTQRWACDLERPGQTINNARAQSVSAKNVSVSGLVVRGKPLSSNLAAEVLVSETWLYDKGFRSDESLGSLIGQEVILAESRSGGRLQPEAIARTNDAVRLREQMLLTPALVLTEQQRAIVEKELSQLRSRIQEHNRASAPDLRSPPLRIVGIYKTPPEGFQSDAGLVSAFYSHLLIPTGTAANYRAETFQSKSGAKKAVNGTVICSSSESVRKVVQRLRGQGFRCTSFADLAFRIRASVLMVTAIVTVVAGVAFLIAAFGMTNTMVMNVLERRREIGILKSIGARDRDVMRMFLAEGLVVGAIGGVLGLSMGLLLTALSENYIRDFLEQRLSEPVSAALFARPLWLLFGTPAIAAVVSTLASVLPARQASRLDPVRTLRDL